MKKLCAFDKDGTELQSFETEGDGQYAYCSCALDNKDGRIAKIRFCIKGQVKVEKNKTQIETKDMELSFEKILQ